MPTYEYACKDCGEHLEVVQSFQDDPLTECPACDGTLKKVFSPIGIAFKGQGFYKTDSRSSGSSGSSSSSDSSSSDSTSSETSSSDKKKPDKADAKKSADKKTSSAGSSSSSSSASSATKTA